MDEFVRTSPWSLTAILKVSDIGIKQCFEKKIITSIVNPTYTDVKTQ